MSNQPTAFVTGASQGLGAALAKHFAANGYSVFVGYCHHSQGAQKVCDEITGSGGEAVAIGGDIACETEVERIFAGIARQAGRLDVLVNNARFDPSRRGTNISDGDWWDMNLSVSLKGTYLCCLAALRLMRARRSGAIVNVSSIRGVVPNEGDRIPYGAAKAGQISLTRSFAKEAAADQVRVNAFLPGAIATENLGRRIGQEGIEKISAEIPLQRIGTVEEMCQAVMFLATNTYTTGACLNCSGGLLML